MLQGKIKVLLLEDNPGDVLLIEEMFKDEAAGRFEISSAARLADGIKRLSEQAFDVVLLDLNLPDSIGIATARSLKQNAPNLPIVILTALADEAIALESLQIGMEDYLVKGQITGALLAHSLRYALERKRVEKALRESELKYCSLVEQSLLGILILQDARIVYMNNIMAEKSGYSFAEAILLSPEQLRELIHPDERDAVWSRMFSRLSGNPEPERNECRFVARDGSMYWADVHTSLIEYLGRPAIQMFIVDITERKRADEALCNSEEKLRLMFGSIKEGIFIVGLDGKVLDANDGVARITGYTREQILGQSGLDYMFPGFRGDALGMLQKVIERGGTQKEVVLHVKTATGTAIEVEANSAVLRDGSGKPIGLIGTLRDISERRRMEEELQRKEHYFRALIENSSDGIMVMNTDGTSRYESPGCLRLMGYTAEERFGHSVFELMHPDDIPSSGDALRQVISGSAARAELRARHKDGTWHTVEVALSNLLNDSAVASIVVNLRDITGRKKAEDALRASEEKYRGIFDESIATVYVFDAKKTFINTNQAGLDLLGYSREELLRMSIPDVDADPVIVLPAHQELLSGGRLINYEHKLRRKDGTIVTVLNNSRPLTDAHGNVVGMLSTLIDITERERAEEALRASEERFRSLVENASEIIFSLDIEGKVTYLSPSVEASIGYKPAELVGKYFKELVLPDDLKYIAGSFRRTLGGEHGRAEFHVRAKNGDIRVIQTSSSIVMQNGKVIGLTGVGTDITERKKAEEDIRSHARRSEALYAIVQVTSQASTIDAMLDEALDKVCDVMDMESGCIFMLDYDDKALKLMACKGLPEDIAVKVSTIVVTEQGIERMINLAGPVTDVDEAQDVVDVDKIREVVRDMGRKSIVAVPFFRGRDLQGLVVVFTTKERVFSHDDMGMLTAISNEIAVGINDLMLQERTRDLSVTDELTGLYNRRHFFEMLDVEMNRTVRGNRPFSLVMLNLDGFKEYNDKFGHINGDAVLQSFSQILKKSVRKSDLVFRYGGDEFALLLPTADAKRAKKIVQRARAIWQMSPVAQSLTADVQVDFSTGIAEYPVNAESADGMVFLADAALYQAKRKGGHDDKVVSELNTLSTGMLDLATQDQVYALAATVDARDPYTYGHSKRVSEIAALIGRSIGMADDEIVKLRAAALLHDIGKVGVPDSILTKVGKPSKDEWRVIKRHSAEGARIVNYVKELKPLVPIILHHHEWYDGTGYPDGLKGVDIPVCARITSIADAYDTMVTKRPYRHVVSPKEACAELKRFASVQFDPALVDVWCKLVEETKKEK